MLFDVHAGPMELTDLADNPKYQQPAPLAKLIADYSATWSFPATTCHLHLHAFLVSSRKGSAFPFASAFASHSECSEEPPHLAFALWRCFSPLSLLLPLSLLFALVVTVAAAIDRTQQIVILSEAVRTMRTAESKDLRLHLLLPLQLHSHPVVFPVASAFAFPSHNQPSYKIILVPIVFATKPVKKQGPRP
jgi:hypothetical protein